MLPRSNATYSLTSKQEPSEPVTLDVKAMRSLSPTMHFIMFAGGCPEVPHKGRA